MVYQEDWRNAAIMISLFSSLSTGVSMIPAIVRAQGNSKLVRAAFIAAALGVASVAPKAVAAQAHISGSGISKVGHDTRKLTISAQAGSASGGMVQFIHNSPAGLTRFRGTVSCFNVSGGTVQLSGVIEKGETATGALLDGKAFGFTINTSASPQAFSLPSFADAGGIPPCGGGRGETVPVTEDGFKLQ